MTRGSLETTTTTKYPEPKLASASPSTGPLEPIEPLPVGAERRRLLDEIGTAKLSKAAREVLSAPPTDEMVNVKPTGEVYVPGVHYRRRLNQAFGSWGLRPLGELQLDMRERNDKGKSTMFREYGLVIGGKLVSAVIGDAEYHPTNERLTYADAAESLRTNALTRLCKDIGLFTEAWDPIWSGGWRRRMCVQVFRDRPGSKPEWRRLDADPFYDEKEPTRDSPNREAWYAKKGGTGRKEPSEGRVRPDEIETRNSAPVAPSPAPAHAQVSGIAFELIIACRKIDRKPQPDAYAIRTSSREVFTDNIDIFGAAQAAMKRTQKVAIVAERQEKAGKSWLWVTELKVEEANGQR
jgi:hypothetical protein